MNSCSTCEYAIFDELWGEYKCKIRQQRVYKPGKNIPCEWYKKGTPTESKDDNYDSSVDC